MTAKPATDRVRLRRLHERGSYDRGTINAVLDAGCLGHVGYVSGGSPVVIPTLYWRDGDNIYWHGSSASRMLRGAEGTEVCLTVTHLDGFVMARSGFHHSANFRSAMIFGTPHKLNGDAEKLKQLELFMEAVFPGRWSQLRPTTAQELKATTILAMPIDEASAKIRTGPPGDDEEDYALPVWAGVLPVSVNYGRPEPCTRFAGTAEPPIVSLGLRTTN